VGEIPCVEVVGRYKVAMRDEEVILIAQKVGVGPEVASYPPFNSLFKQALMLITHESLV